MDAIESNVEAAFAEHFSGRANVLEVSSSVRRYTVESVSPLVIPPLDLTKPKATQLSGGESGVQEGLPVGESNASLADGRKQRMFGQQSVRRLSVKPVSMFGLATRASRDKDELQAKTATYEMMMQHFQVREVNRTHVSGSDFIPTDFTDPMRRTIVRQSSLRQEGDMESMSSARAHSSSDLNGFMNSGRGLAFRRTRAVQGESSNSEDPIVSPTTKEDIATGEPRRRSSVSNVSAHDHERRPSLSMNEGERNVDSAKLLVRRTTSDDFSTLAPPRSRRFTGVPSHAKAREAEMQSKVGIPYSQKCSRRFA